MIPCLISEFPMGQIVMTRGVNDEIAENTLFSKFVLASLKRHAQCDWGDLGKEDTASNNSALKAGGRLFSSYIKEGLKKIWIITEHDRSVTTILFPDEY